MGNFALQKMGRRSPNQVPPRAADLQEPVRSSGEAQATAAVSTEHRKFKHPELSGAITVLTWNVAAVNNNPFEYWITYDDPVYLQLMQGVEEFLDDPCENDVEVNVVFTEEMFQELKELCAKEGMQGLDELEHGMWRGGDLHLSERKIVSEFIKDSQLGSKRLISMPDRVTNTINVVTRQESEYRPPPACRPSVINNYDGDLSSKEVWWEKWKSFMFQETVTTRTRIGVVVQRPVEMLEPIMKNKYPAVTEEEERLAIPLQLLCQAIFDSVVVHFMNNLSPDCTWQVVKAKICEKLYTRKQAMTMEILERRYSEVQVICLQEVAAVFRDTYISSELRKTHELAQPMKLDGKRDQNSLILVKTDTFKVSSLKEVTSIVTNYMEGSMKLADGDLLVIDAEHVDGSFYLLVSFHGDTNGLLTVPVLTAVDSAARERFPSHRVLLCLDANVYEKLEQGKKSFDEFIQEIRRMGLTTCWGDAPDVTRCRTTCCARTSLQPQLNKAVRSKDRVSKSDMNPKDIILFYRDQMVTVPAEDMGTHRQENPIKDNTGHLEYREMSVFPTLDFPSDHGILAVALQVV